MHTGMQNYVRCSITLPAAHSERPEKVQHTQIWAKAALK